MQVAERSHSKTERVQADVGIFAEVNGEMAEVRKVVDKTAEVVQLHAVPLFVTRDFQLLNTGDRGRRDE